MAALVTKGLAAHRAATEAAPGHVSDGHAVATVNRTGVTVAFYGTGARVDREGYEPVVARLVREAGHEVVNGRSRGPVFRFDLLGPSA